MLLTTLVDQIALYGGTHDIIVIKRLSMSFLLRNQNTGYIVYSYLIGCFFAYEYKHRSMTASPYLRQEWGL